MNKTKKEIPEFNSEEEERIFWENKEKDSLKPFIHVRVQHWYRELRRMVCSVEHTPRLRFADDLTQNLRQHHLPILHCRECGQTNRSQGAQEIEAPLQKPDTAFLLRRIVDIWDVSDPLGLWVISLVRD